ncbi:MAG: hypothetical protein LBK92_00955 [Endomicrobium sp.]|jgi:hypothetical protein|nr:hypothetical protein [Endomicrobium sp.]
MMPRTQALRARIARLELERTPEWRAERERVVRAEQERQIAVGLEFQARERHAARMMEEVERLRDGWNTGCSVM